MFHTPCITYMQQTHFSSVDVILLHSGHQHIAATHVVLMCERGVSGGALKLILQATQTMVAMEI
jgi:hypothetical protein